MFTIAYKGSYIHGYFDRPECTVDCVKFKSFRAAQLAITRSLK